MNNANQSNHIYPLIWLTLIAVMLASVISGCAKQSEKSTEIATSSTSTTVSDSTTTVNSLNSFRFTSAENRFAAYKPVQVKYTPSVKMEAVKPDFSNVYKYDGWYFSPKEKGLLKRNHFVSRPSQRFAMYELYEDKTLPAFISSDVILHAYHQMFDKTLMLSERRFNRDLKKLTSAMYLASLEEFKLAQDKKIKEAARRNAAYFGVASKLLGLSVEAPAEITELVEAEINLIKRHNGFSTSPILEYDEDYSQFVPRGHYTKSDDLRRYFKAMMWYGRMGFYIKTVEASRGGARRSIDPALVNSHTRQALLITRLVKWASFGKERQSVLADWQSIYEPTAFFVGYSDDLNLHDYIALVDKVYGGRPSDDKIAGDVLLQKFIAEAAKYKTPRISSTGLGLSAGDEVCFKFMGQRLIPDSYIFQNLVFPETERGMPRGLDIPAALGSHRAYKILDREYKETKDVLYVKKMAVLKKEFSNLNESTWTQNLYWGWLYSLKSLFGKKDAGYPVFMRSEAWKDKSLNTFLGSWAELRHDTVLYGKQSETLLRGLPGDVPVNVDVYVEPNPELYARLLALTEMTKDGLKARGLLNKGSLLDKRLNEFASLLRVCKSVSEKELSNTPISKEENDYFKDFDKTLKSFDYRFDYLDDSATPLTGGWDEDNDQVVVDVHTDTNTDSCLEVATGKPAEIFVIAPVGGKPVLFKGASFTYYEFTRRISKRMTNEEWWEDLMMQRVPSQPAWTRSFSD